MTLSAHPAAVIGLPLLFALLWRLQGGAWFAPSLPGRPLLWVAPILGAAAGLAQEDWRVGPAVAASLLWSGLIPHGRWYTLGRAPRDLAGPANRFEQLVERAAGPSNHLALLMAKTLAAGGMIATAVLLGDGTAIVLSLLLPIAIVAAYEIGWRVSRTGTHLGEWLTGGALGAVAAAL